MIECSNCGTEISKNYCPVCGQKYEGKRATFLGLFKDVFDSFFSVDGAVPRNIIALLTDPSKVVHNYWSGFRQDYLSPFRLIIISTLFLGLNFLITTNKFLELKVSSNSPYLTLPLALYILFLPVFTIVTKLIFIRQKKNFVEHIVLNAYSMGLWTTVFSVVSIIIFLFDIVLPLNFFFMLYLLLIIIWNSLSFHLSPGKRVLLVSLNFLVYALFFISLFLPHIFRSAE